MDRRRVYGRRRVTCTIEGMRLASGLLASALSLSLGFLACTRFTGTDDSGAETEAGTDSGNDAGGFVVVENQTSATEIVANDAIVAWSFAGGISSADPTTPNARPNPLSTKSGVGLQLSSAGDRVFFASADTVYYAETDGSLLDGGPRAITPQGTNVPIRAQYAFPTALTFATDTQLEWCTGGACGTTTPTSIPLDGGVGAMRSDPAGEVLWLSGGGGLRSFTTAKLTAVATIDIAGGVGAFIIDTFEAFYAPTAGGVIYAKDLTSDAAPKTLASITGHPFAFALDSTSLYAAVLDSGTVLKVNKTTGAVTTLAANLVEPRSLALSNGRLLVLTDGKIISYATGE